MNIEALQLHGFKSFQDRTEVVFSNRAPGLYSVSGRNDCEPSLGANGVGKSSLWDAVCWCLFGKTARGQRGASVICAGYRGPTEVRVLFSLATHPGCRYQLVRTQRPNTLRLIEGVDVALGDEGGRDVSQEDVESLIGMDYELFLACVLIGQFGNLFFDLSPTDKLAMFSNVLQLEVWVRAADTAKAKAKEMSSRKTALEVECARLDGLVQATEAALKGSRAGSQAWNEQQESRIREARTKLAEAHTRSDVASAAYRQAADKARGAEAAAEGIKERLASCLERLDGLRSKISKLENRVTSHDTLITRWKEELESLSAPDKVCPTCRRPLQKNATDGCRQTLSKQIDDEEARRVVPATQLTDLRAQHDECSKEYDTTQEAYRRLPKPPDNLRTLSSDATRAQAQVESSSLALERLLLEQNPHTETIRENTTRLSSYVAELNVLRKELQSVLDVERLASYWTTEFKALRLWVVETALREFEAEVQSAMTELGLVGWSVSFDVERENASGGVSRGFAVSVSAPGRNDSMPWESWSGGEAQRLRIAGAMGLSKLVRGRRGLDTNLEVWDEPTAHLSREGVADLLSVFSQRARQYGKQIWLVDHRSHTSGDFVDGLLVVKGEQGSYLLGN